MILAAYAYLSLLACSCNALCHQAGPLCHFFSQHSLDCDKLGVVFSYFLHCCLLLLFRQLAIITSLSEVPVDVHLTATCMLHPLITLLPGGCVAWYIRYVGKCTLCMHIKEEFATCKQGCM
jgi:hypothetical protein